MKIVAQRQVVQDDDKERPTANPVRMSDWNGLGSQDDGIPQQELRTIESWYN
jgi:hypothetical protein